MKRRNVSIRYFQCPDCHYNVIAPKRADRITPIGHLKFMYCPVCKERKNFIQIDERDLWHEVKPLLSQRLPLDGITIGQ